MVSEHPMPVSLFACVGRDPGQSGQFLANRAAGGRLGLNAYGHGTAGCLVADRFSKVPAGELNSTRGHVCAAKTGALLSDKDLALEMQTMLPRLKARYPEEPSV